MPVDQHIYAILRWCGRSSLHTRCATVTSMLWALLRKYAQPYRWLLVGRRGAAIDQHAGIAVPTDRQRLDHRRRRRQGRSANHRRVGRGDARGHRATGDLRGGRRVLRVAGGHGVRPRSSIGDLSPRHRILGRGDRALRRTVAAHPDHQRRPAGPTARAIDLHHADHRADHVDRRHLHGGAPGRRPVVATPGQRADPRRRELSGSCRTCCRSSGACNG